MSTPTTLLPRPRLVSPSGERVRFPHGLRFSTERDRNPSPRLRAAAGRLGALVRDDAAAAPLAVSIDAAGGLAPQGYRLTVAASGVALVGADEAGVFYGLQTLAQVAQVARIGADGAVELGAVEIEDAPAFQQRVVSLDVNRDKVPTMETLFALVDKLSSWKLNQLQLYMEHVYAYAGHEEVWEGWSPFTAAELRALDAYCRERFVELVPNQNTLAHFHRWLVHDRYRELAEVPEGVEHPFALEPEPFSLCTTDERTYDLLGDLFDQLLPNFTSGLFHVGLDEPIDLGLGRSKAAADERGAGRLFLEHLCRVRDMAAERGKTMQFWADWILNYPDLARELPQDVIACEWGYEADHPFEEHLELLSAAVPRLYICPGTSAWNSICGRTSNALANLMRAGRIGRRFGCEGYLIADWGDNGHWQPLPISYPGFLFGAAVAWNPDDVPTPAALADLLDRLVFEDEAGVTGQVLLALGDAHRQARAKTINGSAPFFLLHFAHAELPHPRIEDVTVEGLEATLTAMDEALAPLIDARPADECVVPELRWAADLARAGCRLGIARLRAGGAACGTLPEDERLSLAAELDALADRHADIWLARNREGGREASVGRIRRVADLLR